MVYSEVYNIMREPDGYVEKTIQMEGLYVTFYDSNTDTTYHSCLIQDATACCSQVM